MNKCPHCYHSPIHKIYTDGKHLISTYEKCRNIWTPPITLRRVEDMSNDFKETGDFIREICRCAMLLSPDDIKALTDEISRIKGGAPLFNPTEYEQVADNLYAHEAMVLAFQKFRNDLERLHQNTRRRRGL